ncbi:MAG: ribosome silencing factor [Methylacidiphilales bacterium]|nr:ribosome silencing factor [Candidatus Methylacidiphilales bacterium]
MPTQPSSELDGLDLARHCVWSAQEKKALDPIILDLRNISTITDYLVICSAQSEPQIKAIANGVEQALKEGFGRYPLAVDGFPTSQWIVIDYGDVMFHIFHELKRGVYALEDLWSDAPQVSTLQPK